jgi:hypothetical protein
MIVSIKFSHTSKPILTDEQWKMDDQAADSHDLHLLIPSWTGAARW